MAEKVIAYFSAFCLSQSTEEAPGRVYRSGKQGCSDFVQKRITYGKKYLKNDEKTQFMQKNIHLY